MGKTTCTYAFSIGEEVRVEALGTAGRVDSLLTDSMGPQYHVVYWNGGERCSAWMYAWEISAVEMSSNGVMPS